MTGQPGVGERAGSSRVEFLITLPTRGDGRDALRWNRGDWHPDSHRPLPPLVTDLRGSAYGPFDHLAQIVRAAEVAGFGGAVAPFDPAGEESLVVAAGLLRQTRWLRAVAEFHPGFATPVYAAKVAASLQRFSGDRLDWGLAVDLDADLARAQGDFLEGADRYARADEFLTVAKGVWHEDGYTYEGRFYQVLAGGFQAPLSGHAFPRIHLSGTSAEALTLSAGHADVHVFEPEEDLGLRAAELLDRAAGLNRKDGGPALGLRLPVLAREDDDEAWDEVRRLWIRTGGTEKTLPEPHPRTRLWGGFRVLGAATPLGLVGSYETVAAGIRDYIDRGVTRFVLEATPRIEETYRLGERLLPLFAKETEHAP